MDADRANAEGAPSATARFKKNASFQWAPQTAVFAIVLACWVIATFLPAFWSGIVYWDDDRLLLREAPYRTLTPTSLRWMFTTSFAGHFQPLTWLSYWLDYRIWGTATAGFHATNLLLHVATTLLVLRLAQRLITLTADQKRPMDPEMALIAAVLSAALFACHPLRVESVLWLPERRGLLSGLLLTASILAYVRFAAAGQPAYRWYVVSFALCCMSLLAKATAMVMAPLLLILDWYPLRRMGGSAGRSGRPWSLWLEKVPFLAVGILAALRAVTAQKDAGALFSSVEHSWILRGAQACFGLCFYLWKTIFPVDLSPLYQLPPSASPTLRDLLVVGAVVVAGILLTTGRRRAPGLFAASLAYAVLLAPVLGFAQSGPQLVADRYSYTPSIGLACIAGWFLVRPDERELRRFWRVGIAAVLIVGLSAMTFAQSLHWTDALTLWKHAVQVDPAGSIARVNYADALARAGQYDDAEEHYMAALALAPNDAIAHHHLGDLFRVTGRIEPAIHAYRRTMSLDPSRWPAATAAAELLIDTGRVAEALPILRTAAENNPGAPELLEFLAQLLATYPDERILNGPEAVRWAELACAADRGSPDCLLTLATALAAANRLDEAVSTGEAGLAIARSSGNAVLAAEFERRLAAFRQRRPRP